MRLGNWKKGLIVVLLLSISTYAYAIQKVEGVPARKILNEQVTTNAGTAVQISSTSTPIKAISIKALSTNTGIVYVGDADVDSSNGRELEAGESIDIDIDNLTKVWIDVSVNGEGVSFAAIL